MIGGKSILRSKTRSEKVHMCVNMHACAPWVGGRMMSKGMQVQKHLHLSKEIFAIMGRLARWQEE